IQYIAKSIETPLQTVGLRCYNHLHGHRCIKSSPRACRLLLQTFLKEWVALRSSVNSSVSGTVIGCHLFNKSIHEMSLLLHIPRSTVSGIKTKWKQLGTTENSARRWTLEQWRRVLWSEESRFSVWQSDGPVWVWRLPGEQYLPDCIVSS
ncbi:unnamed protein product, partial [Staurois parvus]